MEIISEWGFVFIGMAVIFGLYMSWGIGANDVANAMGIPVGSGAITVKQAIIIAAVFEFAGAFIAGGSVTKTIRIGKMPAKLRAEVHYSVIRPELYGEEWNFRLQVTPVIPNRGKTRYWLIMATVYPTATLVKDSARLRFLDCMIALFRLIEYFLLLLRNIL